MKINIENNRSNKIVEAHHNCFRGETGLIIKSDKEG